jgi:hypothetical protein
MNRAPISTPDNQAGEIQQKLMAAFKFNMEDLNCNRAGELSERQKARFFRDAAMSFFGPLLGGLVATVVLGDDSLTRIQLPFVCPVFILIAFAAIGFLSYSLNMRPVRENILASATGTLSLLPQFVGGNARAFSIVS